MRDYTEIESLCRPIINDVIRTTEFIFQVIDTVDSDAESKRDSQMSFHHELMALEAFRDAIIDGDVITEIRENYQLYLLEMLQELESIVLKYTRPMKRHGKPKTESSTDKDTKTEVSFRSGIISSLEQTMLDEDKIATLLGEYKRWTDTLKDLLPGPVLDLLRFRGGFSNENIKLQSGMNLLGLGTAVNIRQITNVSFSQFRCEALTEPIKEGRGVHGIPWEEFSHPRNEIIQGHIELKQRYLPIVLEQKPPLDQTSSDCDIEHRRRVANLAHLLIAAHEAPINILHCRGYALIEKKPHIVFNIPESMFPEPQSLLGLIKTAANDDSIWKIPSLEERFRMAESLARTVFQLHSFNWVHRAIRSDNILFFRPKASTLPETLASNMSTPYLAGFDYDRRDPGSPRTSAPPSEEVDLRDLYRHPDIQGKESSVEVTKLHDIYALGVVLLEIGVWTTATEIVSIDTGEDVENLSAEAIRKAQGSLIEYAWSSLANTMGAKYCDVVMCCLEGDFDGITDDGETSDPEGLDLALSFRKNVVDVLHIGTSL